MPLSSMGSVSASRGRVKSQKMRADRAGTEVPETLVLTWFSQPPPTTFDCHSRHCLLPSFLALSFLVSLTMLTEATKSLAPRAPPTCHVYIKENTL